MDFDTVGGLPVHALVVHAVAVLLPLAGLGAIVMVAWTRFSRRFGPLVLVVAGIAVFASLIATRSGDELAQRVGVPVEHQRYGVWVPVAAGVLFVLLAGFWLVDRGIPLNRSRPAWVIVLGIALVLVAVAVIGLTFVVGHSGAQAVWSGIVRSTGAG